MLGQTNALDNGTLVNKVDSIKEDTTYIREHSSSGEMVTITTGSTLSSFIITVNCQVLNANRTYQVPKGSLLYINYLSQLYDGIAMNIYLDSVHAGAIYKNGTNYSTLKDFICCAGIAQGFEITKNITIEGHSDYVFRLDITTT